MAELDALAHGLSILRELTPRTSDYVASRGERLSARIVAAVLTRAGRRAQFVDGPAVIRTNGQFGGASPDLAATDRAARAALLPLLRRRITPVVPGFIGGTPTAKSPRIGRGGSDLSATLTRPSASRRRASRYGRMSRDCSPPIHASSPTRASFRSSTLVRQPSSRTTARRCCIRARSRRSRTDRRRSSFDRSPIRPRPAPRSPRAARSRSIR